MLSPLPLIWRTLSSARIWPSSDDRGELKVKGELTTKFICSVYMAYVTQLLQEVLRLQDKLLLYRKLREKNQRKGSLPVLLSLECFTSMFILRYCTSKGCETLSSQLQWKKDCQILLTTLWRWVRNGLQSEMSNVFSTHVLDSSLAYSSPWC